MNTFASLTTAMVLLAVAVSTISVETPVSSNSTQIPNNSSQVPSNSTEAPGNNSTSADQLILSSCENHWCNGTAYDKCDEFGCSPFSFCVKFDKLPEYTCCASPGCGLSNGTNTFGCTSDTQVLTSCCEMPLVK